MKDTNNLPSKELLEAVLGYPKQVTTTNITYMINITGDPYVFTENLNNIWFNTDNVGLGVCKVDKYHFAFLCKEWAYKLDEQLTIKSYTVRNSGACEVKDKMGIHIETCDALTEVDAIIKTCEFILNEIRGKDAK